MCDTVFVVVIDVFAPRNAYVNTIVVCYKLKLIHKLLSEIFSGHISFHKVGDEEYRPVQDYR